ncbi:multidrug effflux MFS transporter [Chryseobacterium turcicum]|uniref:Multidrug effflux MFS transporter n=1 Tax=Chryseobacterium turcicum TaxID=2898076 RepID=A0A9Q3V7A7_9FLAO|nr:multidrug effflux MFS transporter [Chryseobacterium turcicum]MCD1118940.1 multidrug effflux MFS transporter [Chryseobacterium turcicum]
MRNFSIVVFILALLNALESLSIDLYLPAFPSMATIFNTEIGNIQISISTFFAGFAIGQLLWGPLSDKKGRKPILYAGVILFIIATTAIIFTSNVYILWILRFIQAFGGSAGIVVGRAIVTDLYDRKKAVSIFSTQSQISGIAPILAPIIGSLLLKFWGWESAFVVLSLLGAISLLLIIKYIPETNKKTAKNENIVEENILKSQIKNILGNREFIKNTIIGSIAFASLIVYISNSPFLFMQIHGFSSEKYSLIFAFNSIALILAAYSTPKLLFRFGEHQIMSFAVILLTISTSLHIFASYFQLSVIIEIIFLYLSIFSIGLLFPITTAGALSPFKEGKGVASALLGFLQLITTFIISAIVGLLESDSAMPMIFARASLSIIAVSIIYFEFKKSKVLTEN